MFRVTVLNKEQHNIWFTGVSLRELFVAKEESQVRALWPLWQSVTFHSVNRWKWIDNSTNIIVPVVVEESPQSTFNIVRIMSISATLALSSSEASKEDIIDAMPGLNYDR
jgi:hypothetical protein